MSVTRQTVSSLSKLRSRSRRPPPLAVDAQLEVQGPLERAQLLDELAAPGERDSGMQRRRDACRAAPTHRTMCYVARRPLSHMGRAPEV